MKRMTKLVQYIVMANAMVLVTIFLGLVQGIAKPPDSIPILEKIGIAISDSKFQLLILGLLLFFNLFFTLIWFVDNRRSNN